MTLRLYCDPHSLIAIIQDLRFWLEKKKVTYQSVHINSISRKLKNSCLLPIDI